MLFITLVPRRFMPCPQIHSAPCLLARKIPFPSPAHHQQAPPTGPRPGPVLRLSPQRRLPGLGDREQRTLPGLCARFSQDHRHLPRGLGRRGTVPFASEEMVSLPPEGSKDGIVDCEGTSLAACPLSIAKLRCSE